MLRYLLLPYHLEEAGDGDIELEKFVYTDEIDFSDNFEIKTDRYTLVKKRDWIVSQAIGRIASVPVRAFFWDWHRRAGNLVRWNKQKQEEYQQENCNLVNDCKIRKHPC